MSRQVLKSATLPTAVLLLSLVVAPAVTGFTAGTASPRLSTTDAETPSRDWTRIQTANFEAVSNAPVEDVRTLLEELESFHGSLVTQFLSLRTASPVRTLVVVLKGPGDFDRFKPRDEKGHKRGFVGGYLLPSADINLIVMPRETDSSESLRTVFHEYFHAVVRRNAMNLPTWLNEGLAEFYSTSQFNRTLGGCVIGKVIPWHVELLRSDPMIPLDQLLSRDGAAKVFRGGNPRRVSMFYAQSWALVHYLMLSDNAARERQIKAYVSAIGRGLPLDQAFRSAFGLSYEEASRLLSAYVARSAFPAMTVIQPPVAAGGPSSATALTESEAAFVQGDLLVRLGATNEAEGLLRKALALDPSATPPKVALAIVSAARGLHTEAIDLLRPIVTAEPDNLRAHLALAGAYEALSRYEDALRAYTRATAVNAQATAAWFGSAISALALGRIEESDRALERLESLEAQPDWYQSRAYEAFGLGDFATASRDARSFVTKAGRGAESAPYMAFLAAICDWRLGRPNEANAALAEVAPELAAESWQRRVMDFMQGKLAADAFLGAAKDVEQRTEAHAYVGFKALQSGRRDEALTHLRWVRERGLATYVEHQMAVAELKRLEKLPPR